MKRVLLFMSFFWILTAGNCIQEHLVPFDNPSEHYLNIKGTIDDGLEYSINVMYFKNAQKSGCPVYSKDSEICQIKPESFTYFPQINERTHSVHVPLKELSPETSSWWEPRDISICVGPKDPNAVPHQCQVVFILTKDRHDGNQIIDLICSQEFWCHQGLRKEHVSLLNREYVVNILKDSNSHDLTTSTVFPQE